MDNRKWKCPDCGYETCSSTPRLCQACGYLGDWIQPGYDHTYGRCHNRPAHDTSCRLEGAA